MSFLIGPVATALAVASLVVLSVNLVVLPRIGERAGRGAPSERRERRVSVLIPARNEADTIVECLGGVLAQDGVDLEVFVIDDRSDDDTFARAASVADDRVTVVSGAPLPDGWTGKNWACHQLAGRAAHDVLCFVDADTRLGPGLLADACDVLESEGADLLSCLVAGEYRTTAQRVLLPMVNHALLALFPIALMHSSRLPRVALALGPFVMVGADAYGDIGGHAAAPAEVVDDVRLCRSVKEAGGRVRLANGTSSIRTRWYRDVGGIWDGFSKNAFGAIDCNLLLAVLTCLVLVPLLVIPFVRVGFGVVSGDVPAGAIVQVGLLTAGRVVSAIEGRDPKWSAVLHPVAVVFWGATLARSALLSRRSSSIAWRGREVSLGRR